jgi:hypothetical protein
MISGPSSFPEEIWTAAFNRVSQQIRPYFVRTESHQRALAYLQGLMSQASRKNGWQVAEEMGETTPVLATQLSLSFPKKSANDNSTCSLSLQFIHQ